MIICGLKKFAFKLIMKLRKAVENGAWGPRRPPATASLLGNADTGEMLPYAIKDNLQP